MKKHWSRRLREEWRGLPESKSTRKVRSAADVLPKLMKNLGLDDRFDEQRILSAWKEVVGHPLCQEAVPVRIKNGVLQVKVIQPTIIYVMETKKRSHLKDLQEIFGAHVIRDLRIVKG